LKIGFLEIYGLLVRVQGGANYHAQYSYELDIFVYFLKRKFLYWIPLDTYDPLII